MIDETGKLEMKKIPSKYVIDLVKKFRSLEEQNKYLSKYLQEMVKENDNLQSHLHDLKETLKQAKNSLAELTSEMQLIQVERDEIKTQSNKKF